MLHVPVGWRDSRLTVPDVRRQQRSVGTQKNAGGAATPQPPRKSATGPDIQDLVIRDMLDRKMMGVAKYGTALRAGNGRDALWDAYQEALDLCAYLRQAIAERDG